MYWICLSVLSFWFKLLGKEAYSVLFIFCTSLVVEFLLLPNSMFIPITSAFCIFIAGGWYDLLCLFWVWSCWTVVGSKLSSVFWSRSFPYVLVVKVAVDWVISTLVLLLPLCRCCLSCVVLVYDLLCQLHVLLGYIVYCFRIDLIGCALSLFLDLCISLCCSELRDLCVVLSSPYNDGMCWLVWGLHYDSIDVSGVQMDASMGPFDSHLLPYSHILASQYLYMVLKSGWWGCTILPLSFILIYTALSLDFYIAHFVSDVFSFVL